MILLQLVQAYRYEDFSNNLLKPFFLSKVTKNETIAHTFYWIAKLEQENQRNLPDIRDQYQYLVDKFMIKLAEDSLEMKKSLMEQLNFRERLYELSSHIRKVSGVSNKKSVLRKVISEGGLFDLSSFDSTPIPLDPAVKV